MLESAEFWVTVGFVLLVGGIYRPTAKAIGAMLDARAEKIRSTLDEAAQLREEAQSLLAEYQRKQRQALKETEEMLERAHDEARHLAEEAAENLDRMMERRAEMAREKIAQAEAEAVREVREIAIDVALAAARKLISDGMNPDQSAALVEAAITELPEKIH
jgi:F-type H+-transporting ATPase subunit b